MKKNLLLLVLIVALCMSICSQVWAKDKADPWDEILWEDNKLFKDIVSILANEGLTSEEKTDKIMGLASPTEIESMLNLLINSPKANDECIRCLKKCNRAFCACVAGCAFDDDDCWNNRCLAQFVACITGCGTCQWGAMY